MNAIEAHNLTKRYGDFKAVDEVSFEVPQGQLLGVLGPNGAGKTTTLEMLEGFLAPSAGSVRVLGTDPRRGGRAFRARVGLVLQSTSLDPELTVRESLALFGQLYPTPYRVGEALAIVDLASDAHTKVGALSGGQRRRVDLAIGVIGRPDVLFLDEPTTGLDPEARRHTWAAVAHLVEGGTTVVLTTHYIDEADQLADRIIVLSGGRIVADTTPNGLRSTSGPTTIHYVLPAGVRAAGLPPSLASQFDQRSGALIIRADDITACLRDLVAWADQAHLDLDGLEVTRPSLEDAYLATIGEPLTPEANLP